MFSGYSIQSIKGIYQRDSNQLNLIQKHNEIYALNGRKYLIIRDEKINFDEC